MSNTFFTLPTDPEEFGVVLTPPQLRRIDFSALEFQELQRIFIEYLKTYFADRFNDFVPHNGTIMYGELISYLGDVLAQRSDIIADEAFFPTAQTDEAGEQHLFLINNRLLRATPAIVDIEVSIPTETALPLNIPPGLTFNIQGADGNPLVYELFRAPGDFTSPITIFPGTRGVIAFGIEGQFATPYVFESAGGGGQTVEVFDSNILDEPISVEVTTGATVESWKRIDTLERAGPSDKVYQVRFVSDRATFKFGNDTAGKALLAGQQVEINYRIGGGRRGRISAGGINETRPITPSGIVSAPIEVLFRNPAASNGGNNKETLAEAKLRAPKESATLQSAVSGEDFAFKAKKFSHPVFGSVLKAVATVKTSLNANIIFLHVLAAGPDDIPVLPSLGLKQALQTYFSDLNILTSEPRVIDAAIKPINVKANVIISKGTDPALIKGRVTSAMTSFFDQANWELGQPLYLSDVHALLKGIDGVKFVQLREPVDDIIRSKEGAGTAPDTQVGFDELITLGDLNIKIYGEKIGL